MRNSRLYLAPIQRSIHFGRMGSMTGLGAGFFEVHGMTGCASRLLYMRDRMANNVSHHGLAKWFDDRPNGYTLGLGTGAPLVLNLGRSMLGKMDGNKQLLISSL